jgi:excinuclease ABC subunit C
MPSESLQLTLKNLPDNPGVYLFYNSAGALIYIGKATSLKSRVRSYFSGQKTPRPVEELIEEVAKINYQETDSVLEAIILEAALIKKHQPPYNVIGKDDKSWQYLCFTKEAYPKIVLVRQHDLTEATKKLYSKVFGPYTSGTNLKMALKLLRVIFNFSTCEPKQKRPCLYYQMGQCLGVCTGEISAAEYKRKVVRPLTFFLNGHKASLLKSIEKDMKKASKAHQFEEAGRLRDQVHSLQHIQDSALINKEFIATVLPLKKMDAVRIEGYDISNISGTNNVASMVVFNENGRVPSQYRKFKIKTVEGPNDVACLKEALTRRLNHAEWLMPTVFLIDGGKPQVNAAQEVMDVHNITIPVVGIAKGPERKRNDFILAKPSLALAKWIHDHEQLLIQARDEAHRFAITYHKNLRKRDFLPTGFNPQKKLH